MTIIGARRLGATVAFFFLLGAGLSSSPAPPARAAGDEFDAAAYYKAKCMMCHTATAKKHFDTAKADEELVKTILKGAKNMQAAKLWYDWALTPEAQALGPQYAAYQAPTASTSRKYEPFQPTAG